MSGCLSSSMTGSTDTGPLQPQEDPLPVARPLSSYDADGNGSSARRGGRHRHQPRRRMTSAPPCGQTIQLTPLWEHVVRTRRFPSEVDTQATFVEISERLRDPEWEVRQHALRVLIDVLPTLNADIVDKVMQPVVPELINNLGHPAPAVRKGALDTLRVYLIHSPNHENMLKNILHDGLNRPDAHNPFQTNVTTGIILSAPLLLFPSSNSPPPTKQILKETTVAFASRLVQVPHQEAVLKSLMKIRDAVGEDEFDDYLADYDDKFKKNIDVLNKIYNIKPSKRKQEKNHAQDIIKTEKKERAFDKVWDSDSDTSGIAEEEDEMPNTGGTIPPGRVVLETEIKFNEKTAITMTILEEKDENDSEDNERQRNEIGSNTKSDIIEDSSYADKRKTSRRVHFGGEIVKLRTPDSDETESIEGTPKTRIPLPVSPATKMPEMTRRRPSSQPCSPHAEKRKSKRASRSASNSPKREYTHNAQLSPKKSILARTSSPLIIISSTTEETKNAKKARKSEEIILENKVSRVINSSQEVNEILKKEENILVQAVPSLENNEQKLSKVEDNASKSVQIVATETLQSTLSKSEQVTEKDADVTDSKKFDVRQVSSKQERNYTTTKSSSPERKKKSRESKDEGIEPEKEHLDDQNTFSSKSNSFPFGSPVNECDERLDRLIGGDFIDDDDDDERDVRTFGMIADERAVTVVKYGKDLVRDGDIDGRKEWPNQHDRKEGNASEGNGSVTCSSSEGEGKPQEPSWEELGLVGQEVLDDLHNKDDWRARVRGLERVASALRTSSALIAIESRLGSLLHAVLGGERSCRVAAAGLAVAKVVVAGVSEDALKIKLPQLAWGLARQGGPTAAQLARITMLRLKPSLVLEQFLQPHCLSARNAKTRENALQLLIFSLVTFPSTEFKLETVVNRVAPMVADRRRRVRQAALDTLAVLGQIYDSEDVIEAGRRAAEGNTDAEAMVAAIRARLARKSLPLVSADGLVVYGLQISSTVQTATGPDIDWIIAGSGSVSPGTGRSRGQIIATSRSAQGRASRNEILNNCENPWKEKPNLVALGVGLQSKTEKPTAWQILALQISNGNDSEIKGLNSRNINAGVSSNANLRFEEQLRSFYSPPNYDFVGTDVKNHKEVSDNFDQRVQNRKDINEVSKEKESAVPRGESRIPVLLPARERPKVTSQNREKSFNLERINSNTLRKQTTDLLDNNRNRINLKHENVGSYAAIYQRRKRFQQEENQTLNQTFDSHSHRPFSYTKASGITNKEYSDITGSREALISDDNLHDRFVNTDKFTIENENVDCAEGRRRLSRNMQQQTLVETYTSTHERQRKFTDRNAYRPLRTAPNPSTCMYHDSQNLDLQMSADNAMYWLKDRKAKDTTAARPRTETDLISPNLQENERPFSEGFANSYRRRLRSLSPSQLRRSRQVVKLASNRFHAASMYDIDKATTVNEEEYNVRNRRHFSPEAKGYHVQSSNKEESRYQEFLRSFSIGAHERPKSASSSSSNVSRHDRSGRGEGQEATLRNYNGNDNSGSSTPRSQNVADPAFDVITQQTASHDSVDSFFTPQDTDKVEYPSEKANVLTVDDASKEWSSEDDMKLTSRVGSISRHSNHNELIDVNDDENCNRSTESSSGIPDQAENDRSSARRKSIVSALSNERILSYENTKAFKESLQTAALSLKRSKSLYLSPNHSSHHSSISSSPTKRNSRCGSRNLAEDSRDFSEERVVASVISNEDASVRALDIVGHPPIDGMTGDSPAIIIASRPHSHETVEYVESTRNVENATLHNKINNQESTEEESSVNEERQSKDSVSETNTEPGILKIEPEPVEDVESRRRMPSKVPVRNPSRNRMPSNKRATEKPSEKSKRMVQQCFTQLENKDWEVTMKGLKALSQISKQHPEGLDVCAAGTIGRLLGRHIKNLRSQVARAACLAAGDVFSSQIRGIDQDLDDIAGPLLHRTADTNRFLRADSNAALDQMMQHLPPHKTIGIIVLRGASHQNAIVRAATARLLSDVTDRIGAEHIMILPRDVKDKLLNAGAKLLMDGNLDARNHAKKMFRRLTRCEGFRKALMDAVPETTLRHIDKTMKTL